MAITWKRPLVNSFRRGLVEPPEYFPRAELHHHCENREKMIAPYRRDGTMREMTPKQKIFVAVYVAKPNATKAAIAAGYSKKTAAEMGYKLVHKSSVKEAIDTGLKEKIESIKLVGVKLIQKIEQIVEDTTDTKSDLYNPYVALKAILYLGREQKMDFATVQRKVVSHGDIAQNIYGGRKRVAEYRAQHKAGKKAQN